MKKKELIKNLLEKEKFKLENGNDNFNKSYDYKIRGNELFLDNNIKESNKQILINDYSNLNTNKIKDHSDLIQKIKNFKLIKRNQTYNNFNSLLNKDISSSNNNYRYEIQEQEHLIKPKFLNTKENNIENRNKKIIPKFRSLKLGPKPQKIKLNFKIIKLGRNFSSENINSNLNDTIIKKRILFYSKYKRKKDMKLKKLKISKSQNDALDNEKYSYNYRESILNKENTKNFGQQTMNIDCLYNNIIKAKSINSNFLKIYSYIRLPNIKRINYPQENLNLDNNDCGVNCDYHNNNYFYLKDISNQSINKIYMINPFIRNRIINNLK